MKVSKRLREWLDGIPRPDDVNTTVGQVIGAFAGKGAELKIHVKPRWRVTSYGAITMGRAEEEAVWHGDIYYHAREVVWNGIPKMIPPHPPSQAMVVESYIDGKKIAFACFADEVSFPEVS